MDRVSLGWRAELQQQLAADELDGGYPARVLSVHRDRLLLGSERGEQLRSLARLPPVGMTVGDWLWIDPEDRARRLEPFSLIQRKAAGVRASVQRIAANVDTLFIVSSCNADFNPSRLERYLALAYESRAFPVVVLTKADLADDPQSYRAAASALHSQLAVELIDARDPAQLAGLSAWCGSGQTVALVGSSGVGKTTLINGFTGLHQPTAPIREDDAKGRHTTTQRQMFALRAGGWLIDTPGMRELQLYEAEHGIADLFEEIEALAAACRYPDCRHAGEPGCAVAAALERGELDPRRLQNYLKLGREVARNRETLAERRRKDRDRGRLYRSILAGRRRQTGRDS